jgi:hypothetical protein
MGEIRPLTRRDGREALAFGSARLPVGVSANDQGSAPADHARTMLWALVALFAVTSALTVAYPSIASVTALHLVVMVACALLHAAQRYGW